MNDCMVTSRRFRIISRRVVYSRTKLSLIFMICSHCLSDRRAFSRGLLITPGFLLIISFTCIGSKTNQNVPYINTPFNLFLYSLLIKQSLCQYICKTIYNSFYIFFTFVSTLLKSWKEFMFAGGFGNPRAMSIIFRCFAMSDSFYTINRKRMS